MMPMSWDTTGVRSRPSAVTTARTSAAWVSCHSLRPAGTNVRSPGGQAPRRCSPLRAQLPAAPRNRSFRHSHEAGRRRARSRRSGQRGRAFGTDDRSGPERRGQRGAPSPRWRRQRFPARPRQSIAWITLPLLIEGWLWPDPSCCASRPVSVSQSARPSPKMPSRILRERPA